MGKTEKTINVYLAGPMTGYEDYNYQAFIDAAEKIKSIARHNGLNVQAVHTANTPRNLGYETYIAMSYFYILNSDAVVLLDGWQNSKGANLEKQLAEELEIPVFYGKKDDYTALFIGLAKLHSQTNSEN